MPTRRARLIGGLTAFCSVLMVAVCALVIALVSASQSSSTAGCVNDTLGKRVGPQSSDQQALIDFAQNQQKFAASVNSLFALSGLPAAQQQSVVAAFRTEVATYQTQMTHIVSTLLADQAERAATPLGKC